MSLTASTEASRPPYSNRGVYPANSVIPVEGVDAYCGTVFANADVVYDDLHQLLHAAGLEPRKVTGEKVPYYARNLLLVASDGHRLLQVRAGGANPHPFVECKGQASPIVCGFLRSTYEHRPSRFDVCRDFRAQGLFGRLHRLSRRIAKKHGVGWEPYGKGWGTPDAGRTMYVGSRKSQVFLRIYEKGIEQAAALGIPVTDDLRNWIRIEVEFKPQNPKSKAYARTLHPDAIWGISAWLAEFAQEAFKMQAERININQRRESNSERALRYMCNQYGAHLDKLLRDCGDDYDAFGRRIAELAGIERSTH